MAVQMNPLEEIINPDNESAIDINDTIESAERLISLIRPLIKLAQIIERITRWESTVFCVFVLIINNGTCVLVPSSYYLMVSVTLFVSLAGLGYMHRRTNILAKVIPTARSRHGSGPVAGQHGNQRQPVHDFQLLLVLVNSILQWLARRLTKFYSIIKWDSLDLSIRFYGCVLAVLISLHFLPLRWVTTLVVDAVLLQVPVRRFVRELSNFRHQKRVETIPPTTVTPDSSEYSFSHVDGGGDSDSSEKLDDSSSDDLHHDLDESGSGLKAKERSGVVEKLKEFKRRQQQAGSGSCVSCAVNFTTILKRRHICSHCGNHFCSKCCSNKIPRAFFGATAPAAQTETVPVCIFCYSYLTAGSQGNTSLQGNNGNHGNNGSKEKLT